MDQQHVVRSAVLTIIDRLVDGRSVCFCFDLASLALLALHIGHVVREVARCKGVHSRHSRSYASQGAPAETVALQAEQSARGFLRDSDV